MANAVTVELDSFDEKARLWIAQGRYGSISEVVQEGLCALEREDALFEARVKAKVEASLADPRPRVPLEEAIARIKAAPLASR